MKKRRCILQRRFYKMGNLEGHRAAGFGKRGEGCRGLCQGKNHGVAIAGGVGVAQMGIFMKHVLLCSHLRHFHRLGRHSQPVAAVKGLEKGYLQRYSFSLTFSRLNLLGLSIQYSL